MGRVCTGSGLNLSISGVSFDFHRERGKKGAKMAIPPNLNGNSLMKNFPAGEEGRGGVEKGSTFRLRPFRTISREGNRQGIPLSGLRGTGKRKWDDPAFLMDPSGLAVEAISREETPLGAGVLKVALDFDTLQTAGDSKSKAIAQLKQRAGWYDPAVLASLEAVVWIEGKF
jgi:hypothetical protein